MFVSGSPAQSGLAVGTILPAPSCLAVPCKMIRLCALVAVGAGEWNHLSSGAAIGQGLNPALGKVIALYMSCLHHAWHSYAPMSVRGCPSHACCAEGDRAGLVAPVCLRPFPGACWRGCEQCGAGAWQHQQQNRSNRCSEDLIPDP